MSNQQNKIRKRTKTQKEHAEQHSQALPERIQETKSICQTPLKATHTATGKFADRHKQQPWQRKLHGGSRWEGVTTM